MIEEFTSAEGDEKKPFLAVVSWPTPHGPFTPAPWAKDMYDGLQAPRHPNYNPSDGHQEQKHWLIRQQGPIHTHFEHHLDKTHQKRVESLQSVDEQVGMIVDLLERKGELDNTYIIYTSDNGFSLGQHRLGSDKRHMYETDIRVPFVVSGPGFPRNVTTDRVVLNVDIAPSIYELITGEPNQDMDGVSFVPYLKSLQEALENNEDGNDAATVEDPYYREDFLISFYGEGNPECGLKTKDCSALPDPENFRIIDSYNNTYHCLRSLTIGDYQPSSLSASERKDSIYCKFDDSEDFVEYYDHLKDPWQLQNRADNLTEQERNWFEARIAELRLCKGTNCK